MISGIIVDRRSFLASAGLLGISASTLGIAGALVQSSEATAAADVETFRALSGFLTGKLDLDLALADRAYAQLSLLDADFPRKMAALAEMVRSSDAKGFDALLVSPGAGEEALRATIVTIVSTWYLGFTGTPVPLRAEDDTGFVTFTKALMYEPTIDATVRPSYARAGPGYWIDPPPVVTVPEAPPGIKSWGSASPQGVGTIPNAGSLAPNPEPSTSEPARSDP